MDEAYEGRAMGREEETDDWETSRQGEECVVGRHDPIVFYSRALCVVIIIL